MAQLSFKKLSSIPTSGMTAGTIMFNSTTHSIFVATSATDAEEYGGRLEDVTYSDGILTITKFPETAGGSKEVIKLDFSDAASASDVTKVLTGLYSRVETVEKVAADNATNIGTLQGDVLALKEQMNAGDGDATLVTRMAEAEADIDALQTTVGDANSGLVQKVNQNATAIANKAEKAGNSNQVFNVADPGTNTTAATPKSYVDNAISTAISTVYKIKGCIADKAALVAIKSPSNGDVYNVVAEVIVASNDVGSGEGKFGAAGTYSAGTNWVWIQHTTSTSQTGSETTNTGHWDALGGMITGYATSSDVTALTERVDKLESGENTVKTFGGQYGAITVDADNATNGMVTFKMNGKELQGTTHGLKAAAYQEVETTLASDDKLPTGAAVTDAINKQATDLNGIINNLSVINWAEWE
jgi:hypothetical protein